MRLVELLCRSRWPLRSLQGTQSRGLASAVTGRSNLEVFDTRIKLLQRERAASRTVTSRQTDYLRDEVSRRLCERLLDIDRRFPHVLDYGANTCDLARRLVEPMVDPAQPERPPVALDKRLSRMTAADGSAAALHRDAELPFNERLSLTRDVLAHPESLPYPADTFDAVFSSMSLHWINNLPSVLSQLNNVLKPDAPLLAAMLGGDTLFELRTSLQLASMERRGGISPHTSPLADVRDIGGLLTKAGFQMLTIDMDDIVIGYPHIFALMADLQAMGESNALLGREPGPIHREVLLAADAIYRELHGYEDGTIAATFRVIYMIAWKEGAGQARPLARGSGQASLKNFLEGGGSSEGGKSG